MIADAASHPPGDHEPLVRLHALFWNVLAPGSVAYSVSQLLENLPGDKVDRNLWCFASDPKLSRSYHRPVFPRWFYAVLCKARASAALQRRLATAVVLRSVKRGDIVYVWPPYDLRLIRKAQAKGAIVIAERINCMGQMVRRVLTAALARRGKPLPDSWSTPEAIAEERQQMLQCDFVTAPNPLVVESLREAGVPAHRILETSYGFDPRRLARGMNVERPDRPPVFAFVGLGDVRKGLDVLLEAWQMADVDGKLLIAGKMNEDIRAEYQNVLARPDVHELGFVDDIAQVYAAADVFVFPSHEEGGPQVTYEAAACALPSIVSPMGAGRVVRDQQECLLIDPLNVEDLAAAIRKLATDCNLRQRLGSGASIRAKEFAWTNVGARLYHHLVSVTGGQPAAKKRAV